MTPTPSPVKTSLNTVPRSVLMNVRKTLSNNMVKKAGTNALLDREKQVHPCGNRSARKSRPMTSRD